MAAAAKLLVKCLVMLWRLSRVVVLDVWFGYVDKVDRCYGDMVDK